MTFSDKGFEGFALHNPHLLGRAVLVADFVIRNAELQRVVSELEARAEDTPQHFLVLGQRGMGKTTLLHRIAYAVEDQLPDRYIALRFPEEQYNLRGLGDFWRNCLDALSSALARLGDAERAAELDAVVRELPLDEPERLEERARTVLFENAARLKRRFVLLIDNIDLVLERIGKDDWRLREVLQGDDLVVVGASATPLEATYRYDAAFYDFFDVVRLGGLDESEALTLLRALADRFEATGLRDLIENHPERLESIRVLTGGNPRALVTLFEVLATSSMTDSRTTLEALLDRYTPFYKARFEALPTQAQVVVDAVCGRWDPTTAAEIAADTGLSVNKVSSQLDRLVNAGVLEKVPAIDRETGESLKRQGFQVAERLFNVWYLMRTSPRGRDMLEGLLRFAEALDRHRVSSSGAGEPIALLLAETEPVGDPLQVAFSGADDDTWSAFVKTLLRAADSDVAARVRDRIDRSAVAAFLRPAREAMNAVALGSAKTLSGVAPEIRESARALYEEITSSTQ